MVPLCSIESSVNENPGFLPDHPQNWITCIFCHSRHALKISERSVQNFLSYLADSQTDTSKVWQKHYLLGGGNNKDLGKWKNASDQHFDMICMTLDCVIPTQSSVIQIIHCNVGLKCFFFNFTIMFVIIVMYAYFTDISQVSVEMHLRCDGIYNNQIIANCLQSVPVKEFWKSVNNWRRYGQKKSDTFFDPPCTSYSTDRCRMRCGVVVNTVPIKKLLNRAVLDNDFLLLLKCQIQIFGCF